MFFAKIGIGGGTGYAIEYRGNVFEQMSMDGRMTVCNMSIEAGARCGMIAPDQTTFDYLEGRKFVPEDFDAACKDWASLATDKDAVFDKVVVMNAADIRPMVTYGTHPGMAMPIDAIIPEALNDADKDALEYMQVEGGKAIAGLHVDKVFIGSCTNSRMEDLRAAADIFKGRKVASNVTAIIVPGSEVVKKEAEAEGLHDVFTAAGAQWREPGCSMCLGMNGDIGQPGELIVSTSNRNFAGRQGPGVRTVLASPETAATAAIFGVLTDPRALSGEAA